MQSAQRVQSIKYGSPFHRTHTEHGGGEPLPVVLYGAPSRDDRQPEPAAPCATPGRWAAARCRLGRVTFCIRGHRLKHEQDAGSAAAEPHAPWSAPALRGYSVRAAQIVEHADDQCLVVPLAPPCHSPTVRAFRRDGDAGQHMASWAGFGLESAEVRSLCSRVLRARPRITAHARPCGNRGVHGSVHDMRAARKCAPHFPEHTPATIGG